MRPTLGNESVDPDLQPARENVIWMLWTTLNVRHWQKSVVQRPLSRCLQFLPPFRPAVAGWGMANGKIVIIIARPHVSSIRMDREREQVSGRSHTYCPARSERPETSQKRDQIKEIEFGAYLDMNLASGGTEPLFRDHA
jgi:hypothetical protein